MSKGSTEHTAPWKYARLIPTLADSKKEERATSILLAALMSVYEFRKAMLLSINQRVGARTKLEAWTEVVFKDETPPNKKKNPDDRPDGLIALDTGRKKWQALIEAKVNNDVVGEEQLLKYIKRAKEHDIDAVITITNQFVAYPTHHPVAIPKKNLRTVEIFHWSWTYIVTMAQLLLDQDKIESQDQRFILAEVVKYLNDPSSGKSGFSMMNKEWDIVVKSAFNKSKLSKNSEEVINTIDSWHQEQRELCLQMWPLVGEKVDVKLPRAHRNDPKQRMADDCEKLVSENTLSSVIEIPNAAADLIVTVDTARKSIKCSMQLEAPKDKKSSSAKINWLTRQLPTFEKGPVISINAIRKGKATNIANSLEEVRKHPSILEAENTDSPPVSFEVFTSLHLGSKFGRKVFIEHLEQLVPDFYAYAGQYLKAWVAPAPKVKRIEKDPEDDTEAQITKPDDE